MDCDYMNKHIKVAKGEIKSDLVLKNAKVVDVFCHAIKVCDVAVSDGKIIGLGSYSGEKEVDVSGKYVMPSFTDSHAHIESSMLTPAEYAKAVVPKGVTAVIADPHEIVNVCGEDGLDFMIKSAEGLPMDIHFMLPSCVPATPHDSSGCVIDGDETLRLFEKYPCFGLGEMMNFPGVLAGDRDILKKIACAKTVDGHAPMLSGNPLCAYIGTGIRTDHECMTVEEVLEKVSLGMYVLLREGSSARNLSELYGAVNPHTLRRLTLCTDDKHLDDILTEGTVSHCVNLAIKLGIDPIDAIVMATINAAECYGLTAKGAIAPGYDADFLVCADLSAKNILEVYKGGSLVAKDGKALFEGGAVSTEKVTDTIHIQPLSEDSFKLDFDKNKWVIEAFPHSLYTAGIHCDTAEGLNIAAVVERHKATGNVGKCFVKGFSIENGAAALSIGHDSHNICVIGDNPTDMLCAVNALGTTGGIAVASAGRVLADFPLPIAGLMSDKPAPDALAEYSAVVDSLNKICKNADSSLFMLMSFLSLLVIPDIKLSDKGIFDVNRQALID